MRKSKAKRRKLRAWQRVTGQPPPSPVGVDRTARDTGHRDYTAYLQTEHWTSVGLHYAAAWPGCCCLACGSDRYQLHHVRYSRLGQEQIHDLLPLCKPCHEKLHACHRRDRVPVADYRRGMAYAFGWSPEELSRRLEPWNALHPGPVIPEGDRP